MCSNDFTIGGKQDSSVKLVIEEHMPIAVRQDSIRERVEVYNNTEREKSEPEIEANLTGKLDQQP